MNQTRKPTHPGAIFKRNVLERLGLTVTQAADHLGVTRKALSEFVNEQTRCSKLMARKLAVATGTGVTVWINLQAKLDAWEAEQLDVPEVKAFPDIDVA